VKIMAVLLLTPDSYVFLVHYDLKIDLFFQPIRCPYFLFFLWLLSDMTNCHMMAVCHPLKPRLLCSQARSGRFHWSRSALISTQQCQMVGIWGDRMEKIGSKGKLVYTKNPNYEKYILINYILLNWLLPIATPLILNSLILCRVKSSGNLSKTRIHTTL